MNQEDETVKKALEYMNDQAKYSAILQGVKK
jgi:hypothetical protein